MPTDQEIEISTLRQHVEAQNKQIDLLAKKLSIACQCLRSIADTDADDDTLSFIPEGAMSCLDDLEAMDLPTGEVKTC